jgi:hypothetical protein
MSVRVEWAHVDALDIEVVDEVEDAYGQQLRAGWVALLGADSILTIEGPTVAQLRDVAARILQACTDFEAGDRS